ncbi:MAG: hypothetical protein ACYCW6_14870 [Candidatus Xenobia bacterium]
MKRCASILLLLTTLVFAAPWHRPANAFKCPDFPPGLPWFNSKPLTMHALHGKMVLLDFWTYG